MHGASWAWYIWRPALSGLHNHSALDTLETHPSRGKKKLALDSYFSIDAPQIRYVDQSTLVGNILVKPGRVRQAFDPEAIEVWDWSAVDIRNESQTLARDPKSIQYNVIEALKKSGKYAVVFDDDGAGEVADVVGIVDGTESIELHLYHCKYANGNEAGSRVKDLYEVCGQAEKSVKWCSNAMSLVERLISRENERRKSGNTRIEVGDMRKLCEIRNKLRRIRSRFEISIVQPGVDSGAITEDMARLLNGSAAYLLDTFGIKLHLICS